MAMKTFYLMHLAVEIKKYNSSNKTVYIYIYIADCVR